MHMPHNSHRRMPSTAELETENLEKRFLSRCRVIEFSSYGLNSEISGLLEKIWVSETNNAPKPNFQRIAKDSTNNVRDALMQLEVEVMTL